MTEDGKQRTEDGRRIAGRREESVLRRGSSGEHAARDQNGEASVTWSGRTYWIDTKQRVVRIEKEA
jgi:hypothetical protein